MEATDAARRGPLGRPPGRLTAREEMDRVVVRLPAHLRGVNRAYAAFAALSLLGFAAYAHRTPGLSVFGVTIVNLLPLAALWTMGNQLASLIPWKGSESPLGIFFSGYGAVVLFGYTLITWDDALLLSVAFLAAGAAYVGAMLRQALRAPVLTFHPAQLEIRRWRSREGIALEEIADADLQPALRGLRDDERAWLLDLVREKVKQRREALERGGHDLSAKAAPPPELLASRER